MSHAPPATGALGDPPPPSKFCYRKVGWAMGETLGKENGEAPTLDKLCCRDEGEIRIAGDVEVLLIEDFNGSDGSSTREGLSRDFHSEKLATKVCVGSLPFAFSSASSSLRLGDS
eukprot:Hpha_TRINITY_DN16198_c1_g1::TRINITY_DN16198_c1_g1_i2::g.6259::m.6259